MKKMIIALTVAVAAFGFQPQQASADLSSSMTGTCLAANCSLIGFTLNVGYAGPIESVGILSLDATKFLWSGVTNVWGNGVLLTAGVDYTVNFVGGSPSIQLEFFEGAPLTGIAQPMVFTVTNAAVGGTLADLTGGYVLYEGDVSPSFTVDPSSFSGTVTPEPTSIILLGTGLIGVAAIRRRRQNVVEEE